MRTSPEEGKNNSQPVKSSKAPSPELTGDVIQPIGEYMTLPGMQHSYITESRIHTAAGCIKARSESEVIIEPFFKNHTVEKSSL